MLVNIKRNAQSKGQKDSAQNLPKERLKKKFVENDLSTRTTETHNSATENSLSDGPRLAGTKRKASIDE